MLPNVYSQGRLYSGLKDLCLLIEALLRKKQNANHQINLGELLTNVLAGQNIGYPQNNLKATRWANNIQDLLTKLEQILDSAACTEVRRAHCLQLIRNFTGHHFDLSETATSPNGKTFFDLYGATLMNVLLVVMYFKHIGAI